MNDADSRYILANHIISQEPLEDWTVEELLQAGLVAQDELEALPDPDPTMDPRTYFRYSGSQWDTVLDEDGQPLLVAADVEGLDAADSPIPPDRFHRGPPPTTPTTRMGRTPWAGVCRMNDTNRAAAIFRQDPDFLARLQRFIGATIEAVELSVNDPIGTISLLTVRMPEGTTEELDGPMLAEDLESGVLGFELQECYELDELRRLPEAAIADPDNGLEEHDRRAVRDELEGLDGHYKG